MHSADYFRDLIERELASLVPDRKPERLYEPVRYMLSLGGKRLRPTLLLLCHELFNGDAHSAIGPAAGLEIFHNFTLLHDDIMDKAPLRRSHQTVHEKWNANIAILSGDAMFVISCMKMMEADLPYRQAVMSMFLDTALQVCDGQQLDMDFELVENVSGSEYLRMISLKTACLLGCACHIGSLLAGAGEQNAEHLYLFGKNLGIAFQLHDDILDAYGHAEKTGKQVGGDILANKKTILLITALDRAAGNDKTLLQKWIRSSHFDPQEKVNDVIAIFNRLGVRAAAEELRDGYFRSAMLELEAARADSDRKKYLQELTTRLMNRET